MTDTNLRARLIEMIRDARGEALETLRDITRQVQEATTSSFLAACDVHDLGCVERMLCETTESLCDAETSLTSFLDATDEQNTMRRDMEAADRAAAAEAQGPEAAKENALREIAELWDAEADASEGGAS